jgi:hypothetical protein
MKTSSAKAKGRRLQDLIRDTLRELGKQHGLEDADFTSAIMGTSGVDLIISPAGKKVLDLSIEAKNVEALNVMTTFYKHYEKYKDQPSLKVLVHSKNRTEPLITLQFKDFIALLTKSIAYEKASTANVPVTQ